MLDSLRKKWQHLVNQWLDRRLPRLEQVTLGRKSIFTFPSRAGGFFCVLLVLLWVLAINYENNVVFVFGALLGGVLIVSIFHGYSNLSGLTLRILAVDSGFPGDSLRVDVEVSQEGRRYRGDIWLHFPGSSPQQVSLGDTAQRAVASLYVQARKRGRCHTDRLTMETGYPLGLIRVWTHVLLNGWGAVYPRPVEGQPSNTSAAAARGTAREEIQGSEDFGGLNPYREGESWSRIAWKHLARGQGLYSKHFVDPVSDPQWLEWNSFPGLDRESRLSRLCSAVLQAEASRHPYGLRLPGQESELGQGEIHRDRLLRMLALFECGE